MPVQINEVIIRAIITGDQSNTSNAAASGTEDKISEVTKEELLELIEEVINDKKER